jgi:hypothetical protein
MIKNFYHSIKLNLGIKTFFEQKFKQINDFADRFGAQLTLSLHRITSKILVKKINDYYGADYSWGDEKSQNLDLKHDNLGYGLYHYTLIRNQRPENILCVGSMYGFIPFMMAQACQANNYGTVHFVDAGFDIESEQNPDNHFFGQGFWKKINPEKHFSYLLDSNYIKTYVMTSQDYHQQDSLKYDYIYLDGDHTYQGAKRDVINFWPKLNQDGFLCFHDIHLEGEHWGLKFGYHKIWKELKDYPYKFELSNHYSGLGFLQKIGDQSPVDYL